MFEFDMTKPPEEIDETVLSLVDENFYLQDRLEEALATTARLQELNSFLSETIKFFAKQGD